ncbi:MAG: LemA family protein [Proteiniphilum sp.]|jgi:LemA protein|nr:LemA family protein [Proteiniphilum sp.]MDD3779442.1 LemA family protein [Proteiniphilum sp.]MDD3956728.1 LemA family protein [Proteiniphilum sp.]
MHTLTIILIAAPLAFLLLLGIILSNTLTARRNEADNAFASVDAYLKKRFDLIPNLVAAVQQYMVHEKSILTEITALRSEAMKTGLSSNETIEINNRMNRALHSVNVAMENYPDLKANTNILQLQASLNEVEEQLSAARRTYNATVLSFNNGVQLFPSSLIASMRGLRTRAYLETPDQERNNIDVDALFNKRR